MPPPISRRQFLRGDFTGRTTPLRPPWALSEELFRSACTRCDACIRSCPENILQADREGYPVVAFACGECTFCGECVSHCEPQALQRVEEQAPWRIKAHIGSRCLALKDVVCRACGDACGEQAIRFRPQLGGAARPELDPGRCTGCGACYSSCPANAIAMRP